MGDSAIHAAAGSVGGVISMPLGQPLHSSGRSVQAGGTVCGLYKNHEGQAHMQSLKDALRKTWKTEGLSGLYSGLGSSLLGIVVTNGVYYGFYEEARSVLLRRRAKTATTPQALTTAEGILAGLIAGSITTLTTNPIWTVQTAQAAHAVVVPKTNTGENNVEQAGTPVEGDSTVRRVKLSAMDAVQAILKKDGVSGFWRGIGPALILVINPVIQYTTFERLVALLLTYRLSRKGATPTTSTLAGRGSLSDWDMFILGAASKLVATGITYPYIVVKSRLQAATHKYKSSLQAVLHILKTEGVNGLYAGLLPKLIQSMLTAAFLFVAQRRIFEAVKLAVTLAQQKRLAAR